MKSKISKCRVVTSSEVLYRVVFESNGSVHSYSHVWSDFGDAVWFAASLFYSYHKGKVSVIAFGGRLHSFVAFERVW